MNDLLNNVDWTVIGCSVLGGAIGSMITFLITWRERD